jgi:hypothetical protein
VIKIKKPLNKARNQLVFLVTDKCNAHCEVCGFNCAPNKNHVFDEQLMLNLIDQAAAVPGIDSIFFSGGEPMLYPRLIAAGATRAKRHKLQVVIVSNGYWGKWPAGKLAAFFEEAKPDRIHFSTDCFHRPFIDDQTFGRAVAFTFAMGVYAHIAISQMRVGLSALDYWNTMGTYKHLVPYFLSNESRFGRAMQFRPDDFFEGRQSEKNRCIHDNSYGVTWNGLIYPCCTYEGYYSALAIGDTRLATLDELVNNAVMRLVRLLETEGFSPLLAAARRVDPALPADDFSRGCTACHTLFRTVAFVRKWAPLVDKTSPYSEAVREYLDFVGQRGEVNTSQWILDDVQRRVSPARRPKPLTIT